MRIVPIIAVAVLFAPTAWASGPPETLPATSLRDAIEGKEFTDRGMILSGDSARAFAQGYIAAIAATQARAGGWCDPGIAPHEVMARVYDHVGTLGPAAWSKPADVAVADMLRGLAPCPEKKESP